MRSLRVARWAALAMAAVVLAAVGAHAPVTRTSAAYLDRTHARTEAVSVSVSPGFTPGTSRNSRMVDTGLGVGADGNAYQWGRTDLNISGPVDGIGTGQAPTRIIGLPEGEVCQVSGMIYSANALTCDGQVWGWGASNASNGTDDVRPGANGGTAEQVRIGTPWTGIGPLLDEALLISSTEYAGAAVRSDGTVWHWGGGAEYGGNGATRGASQVAGLPDPSVAGNRPVFLKGAYTAFFVILENGTVYYWGGPSSLPADYSGTATSAVPLDALAPWFRQNVTGSEPYVVAVDGGIGMGGAILSDGRVLSWSHLRDSNRIGDRPTAVTPAGSPGYVPGLPAVKDMQFGFTGVVFGTENGELWGYGALVDYGGMAVTPKKVDADVVAYASGQGYYIWQRQDGTFWGRGYNPAGAIGTPLGGQAANREISYDMSAVTR